METAINRGRQTFIIRVTLTGLFKAFREGKAVNVMAVETNRDIMNSVPLGNDTNYAK